VEGEQRMVTGAQPGPERIKRVPRPLPPGAPGAGAGATGPSSKPRNDNGGQGLRSTAGDARRQATRITTWWQVEPSFSM
jgi:hypothetical protein